MNGKLQYNGFVPFIYTVSFIKVFLGISVISRAGGGSYKNNIQQVSELGFTAHRHKKGHIAPNIQQVIKNLVKRGASKSELVNCGVSEFLRRLLIG